jgi:N-acetyl-alpha-D-muramate 1-phosphate uridylyltransferase
MNLPVAILAGGLATRLRPLTETIPKILLEVSGRPFAEWQLELLRSQGIERVVYCLGHLGDRVVAHVGDGHRFGVACDYVFDGPSLLGTGGALRRAVPKLGEAFFVLYGDSYLRCDFAAVRQAFETQGKPGLMTVFENTGQWDRSNVWMQAGQIVRYDKARPNPAMRHIDFGLGVLKTAVLQRYPETGCLDLATVYQDLLARQELGALEVTQRFYEIGSFEGLNELNQLLSRGPLH